ncbi:MAG: nucleotidyl transferase AbiEii/AbiGii toxin family protein [Desulfobacteraceae bacterium]|nr:nucleotidyl transferase AbiEii/AbiGii toxin family protein [Desulfobacteraceae bacterium]
MQHAIEEMLGKYDLKTPDNYKSALKEIIQEVSLLGLSRSNFFDQAAFYGGTALRIFYGLDRFSEDLDFSLLKEKEEFDIAPYCNAIKNELGAYGFEMEVRKKKKTTKTGIESAFIKGKTVVQMLNIHAVAPPVSGVHDNEVLKIKLEIDTTPPGGADYEVQYGLRPIPYSVRLFTAPSLFAGKIHAILCRGWKGQRIKGRDLYDFVWYISREIPVNLKHLACRMKQTGHLENSILSPETLINLLKEKFRRINYKQAKNDIAPFISDQRSIDLWSEEFFQAILSKISIA